MVNIVGNISALTSHRRKQRRRGLKMLKANVAVF